MKTKNPKANTSKNLDELTKAVLNLPESDKEALLLAIREDQLKEKQNKSIEDKSIEDNQRLSKFVKSVSKTDLQKRFKRIEVSGTMKVTATIDWELDDNIENIDVDNIIVDAFLNVVDDDVVKEYFQKECSEYQNTIFKAFQEVNQLAKEHEVDQLPYMDEVSFLWFH